MKVSRFDWDGVDPARVAREIRALQPQLGEVTSAVGEIIEAVEAEGDAAVLRFEERFGNVAPKSLRISDDQLRSAPEAIPSNVADALRIAVANVAAGHAVGSSVTAGDAGAPGVALGHRRVSVAAAGAYVPGGGGAYPSTAIMSCVPAQAAKVRRIAIASPPGPDGNVHPLVLAAAALAGATEAYAMGGAQAIAALGLGTESVPPVDVVVGPGNRYVQEAKRQLVGKVGIDGIAGPSELMVIADESSPLHWIALDLCAQAEHADDGLLIACTTQPALLTELDGIIDRIASERPSVTDAPLALVTAPSLEAATELADAVAPEHLELACEGADRLAKRVHYPGCVLVGPLSATAFGDYAAGSNHVLPTGGAGRFMGPLSAYTFLRELTVVKVGAEAMKTLVPTAVTLADAEGFPVHGESARARARQGPSK